MQRIALALIVVAALVAGLAAALNLRRRSPGGATLPARRDGQEGMKKIAFVLLAGVMLYAALGGAG